MINPPTNPEAPADIRIARYQFWVNHRRMWLPIGATVLLVAIFIMQVLVGMDVSIDKAGLKKGTNFPVLSWRVLSGPMLHANFFHVFFNVLAFLGLSMLLARLASSLAMMAVLVLSMMFGSYLSILLMPDTTSVGASGGVLGLIGFLCILGYRHRKVLPPGFLKSLLVNVGLIAFMGIVAFAIIDNSAHAGGLICGALLGHLWIPKAPAAFPLQTPVAAKIIGLISCAAFLATAVWIYSRFFIHL